MNTQDIIRVARRRVSDCPANESSARLCLADAVACYDAGDLAGATRRATKSLAYSVGLGHGDYIKARSSSDES